jgi:hypothetical protein
MSALYVYMDARPLWTVMDGIISPQLCTVWDHTMIGDISIGVKDTSSYNSPQ